MDISNLPKMEMSSVADFGGAGVLNFTWVPGVITPHVKGQLLSEDEAQVASALGDILRSWDLTQDGEPVDCRNAIVLTNNTPEIVLRKVADQIISELGNVQLPTEDQYLGA